MEKERVFDVSLAIKEDDPAVVCITEEEYNELLEAKREANELLTIAIKTIKSENPLECYNAITEFMVRSYPLLTECELTKGAS